MSEVPLYAHTTRRIGGAGTVRTCISRLQGSGSVRFRGGLVFKAHRLCVSLNSRLESDKEEEEDLLVVEEEGQVHPLHGTSIV